MAINLHLKYATKLADAFAKPSYLNGYANEDYDWIGVKTIRVSTVITQPLGNYTRSGTTRYGTPTELQDTYQEMSVSQDKSFSITVDKGNNLEQSLVKNAGKALAAELREQAVPAADKYAFEQWILKAGCVKGLTKPTKATIVEAVLDGLMYLDDALVPDDGRTVWIHSEMHKFLREAPEFLALDKLGQQALSKGHIGQIAGAAVVKLPNSYLPKDCFFLITHKDSVLFPKKINEAKIHEDPPGISGALLEGRVNYDAFVLGRRSDGVYVGCDTSKQQPLSITDDGTHKFTIASANADSILYTTDGSDPRYSPTALAYTGQVTLAGAGTVNAVATRDAVGSTFYFPSEMKTQAIA